MKVDLNNPRHCFLLFQQGFFTLLATVARIFLPMPERKVVVLYGHQFSGNLKALYEQWQQSHSKHRLNLFFMSLDPEHVKELKRGGIQAIQCNKLSDMLVIAKSSAIISDHGLHLLSLLIFVTDIVFVDVWHGIPFKGFTPGDFHLQRRYDEVWVSSPFMKFIYESKFGFRPERVHALGYARTDKLFKYPNSISRFRDLASIPQETRIVLYAPTWQQDDSGRELVPFGETIVSFLGGLAEICGSNRAVLVIRSHLNTRICELPLENVMYCPQHAYFDSEDLLLSADILICDWSSIAFDFLALNKPTLFVDVVPPFRSGFTLGKEYRFGIVVGEMELLERSLKTYLDRPELYLLSQFNLHRIILDKVYGFHTDGLSAHRQLDRLISIVAKI